MLIRSNKNPIISPKDINSELIELKNVSSVFNPGAIKFNKKYILLLRVQNRGRKTFLLKAESCDGLSFKIDEHPIKINNLDTLKNEIYHIYDPRITNINNNFFIIVAFDLDIGSRLGLIKTTDFENFEYKGIISKNDNRNGVLFPEKINNLFTRLERPNVSESGGVLAGNQIHISYSKDSIHWEKSIEVMKGNFHYWDELIGAGAPPIKTKEGWLVVYHGVATHFTASNIYQAGVVVLDLENPNKVIYRSEQNILEPKELYEQIGQVNNVVFPTGIIVEDYDEYGFAKNKSEVKIYYGAADYCVAVAFSTVMNLLKMAKNEL